MHCVLQGGEEFLVVLRCDDHDSPNVACERADKAVYYAKHNGRNQVCSQAALVRRGLLTTDVIVGDMELF